MTGIDYEIVDMFSEVPFNGCALAVVPDASGLTDAELQAVAAELALTETAFVLPPRMAGASYRVRVFTAWRESPYGGHSAVGTATALVRLGRVPPGELVQECGGRLLTVAAREHEASLTVEGPPLPAADWDHRPLLAACGLLESDLAGAPCLTGFRPAFHLLPVTPRALERAVRDDAAAVWQECPDAVLVSYDQQQQEARTRVFAPGYGMPEDPACAFAALGLGAWLAQAGLLPGTDGDFGYRVRQGGAPGRSALLEASVTVRGGRARAATVRGRVTATACGRVHRWERTASQAWASRPPAPGSPCLLF